MPKNLETASSLTPVIVAPLSWAVGSGAWAEEIPRKQAKSTRFPSILGKMRATFQHRTWGGLYIDAIEFLGNSGGISTESAAKSAAKRATRRSAGIKVGGERQSDRL